MTDGLGRTYVDLRRESCVHFADEQAEHGRAPLEGGLFIDTPLWRDQIRNAAEIERQRYRSLFDHAPIPYLVTHPDGMIREANHAAGILLRRRPEYLVGKPLAVFLPIGERAAFRQRLFELRVEKVASVDVRFTLESRGTPSRFIRSTVGVVNDRAGNMVEIRWLLLDDTERNTREREATALGAELERRVEVRTSQLEALLNENAALLFDAESARRHAESADREKTELIARVSHELRTPLSAIGGYIEMLSLGVHGQLTPRQAVDVARVKSGHQHILSLLDDLLSFFRLGTGQLRVDLQCVRVADALGDVLTMLAPQADGRGVRCSYVPGSSAAIVRADPERVRQVLINLLANAIKFTARGGSVELTWADAPEHIDIEVRDTGIGIPTDRLDAIFEPFVQLDTNPGVLAGGFGLGLAISRGLAHAMSGTLSVVSAPRRGSTFTLRLPRADAVSPASAPFT